MSCANTPVFWKVCGCLKIHFEDGISLVFCENLKGVRWEETTLTLFVAEGAVKSVFNFRERRQVFRFFNSGNEDGEPFLKAPVDWICQITDGNEEVIWG